MLPEAIRNAVHLVPSVPLDISASQLRAFVREGRSLRYLTPDNVIEYIRNHQLYLEGEAPAEPKPLEGEAPAEPKSQEA